MSEAVDGDQGQVLLGFAQVVKRMGKLDTVGDQEVDVFWKENCFLVLHPQDAFRQIYHELVNCKLRQSTVKSDPPTTYICNWAKYIQLNGKIMNNRIWMPSLGIFFEPWESENFSNEAAQII